MPELDSGARQFLQALPPVGPPRMPTVALRERARRPAVRRAPGADSAQCSRLDLWRARRDLRASGGDVSPAVIRKAERPRHIKRPASAAQRHEIVRLAAIAEIETPSVFWSHDADKVIELLESIARQPTLGAMG